jgi:hypothetical protein
MCALAASGLLRQLMCAVSAPGRGPAASGGQIRLDRQRGGDADHGHAAVQYLLGHRAAADAAGDHQRHGCHRGDLARELEEVGLAGQAAFVARGPVMAGAS